MHDKWYLKEQGPIIEVFQEWNGKPGMCLGIGSTALRFRAPRQGATRGEPMFYKRFTEADRKIARLIAAAPDLLNAAKQTLDWCDQGGPMDWALITPFRDALRAAVVTAEGDTNG